MTTSMTLCLKCAPVFKGLVRVLAKSLYPEPDVFVRELLQNAHDSIQFRRLDEPELRGEIRVDVDEAARTLSFSDNGAGMDQREIEDFLSVIGSTGTGSRAQELASRAVAVATIGQFGIGLLSAFVVAERIDVYTRKPGAARAWRWTNHGGEDYDLAALPVDGQPPGTRVAVTLAPNQTAFLDGRRIRQIVRRYADLLPFPDPAQRLRADQRHQRPRGTNRAGAIRTSGTGCWPPF